MSPRLMCDPDDERNVPWSYRRLGSSDFHDATIVSAQTRGDCLLLELDRASCPWAPGPVGPFRLCFGDLIDASVWHHDGRRLGVDDSRVEGAEWLAARTRDGMPFPKGHLKYEIETTIGTLQIACRRVHFEAVEHGASTRRAAVDIFRGRHLIRARYTTGLTAVWFDFRGLDAEDVVSLGVNCDFRILSRHKAIPEDRWACLLSHHDTYHAGQADTLVDLSPREWKGLPDVAEVVDATVGSTGGPQLLLVATRPGAPSSEWVLRIDFAADETFPQAGCTDWWAIHRAHESVVFAIQS